MGRPRTSKNHTIHPAHPDAAKKAAAAAVERLHPGSVARRCAEADKAAQAALASGQKPPRSKYLTTKLNADPIRAIIFDQLAPDAVLNKVRLDGHISVMPRTVSDTPLDYLRFRVALAQRIDEKCHEAGKRYLIDNTALGTMGSNTAAIITHLQSGPTAAALKEAKLSKSRAEANGTDYLEMRSAVECAPVKDPSDRMLAAAARLRRITEKLEPWERSVLDDLIVRERTLGMIALRWGANTESMSLVCRLALWKLARVYEECDQEFAAWVSIERQLSGEAKS